MKKLFLFTCLLFCIQSFVQAQTYQTGTLDSLLDQLAADKKFYGSVAISVNGHIIYAKACGIASIAENLKPNTNTRYSIGSITKSFTAALIFKAIDQNKMKLTDKLSKWFPTIAQADAITIENMLNHTSGIGSFTDAMDDYYSYNSKPARLPFILAKIEKAGSKFSPGKKMEYSNSNYYLLSYILEKVNQKPYSWLLKNYINNPAQLVLTNIDDTINVSKNMANSYQPIFMDKILPTHPTVPYGAGGISSTPTELLKFLSAMFDGKIVSKSSLDIMTKIPASSSMGMGFIKFPFNGKFGYGHDGSIDGFKSFYGYFPEDKIGFAIVGNMVNTNMNDIAIQLLRVANKIPIKLPTPKDKSYKPSIDELNSYVGEYSTKEMPIKIKITSSGTSLKAQATGQSSFPLTAIAKNTFEFDAAGIVITFFPEKRKFIIAQSGTETEFTKD